MSVGCARHKQSESARRQTDRQTARQINRQAGRRAERQTNGQTDSRTVNQSTNFELDCVFNMKLTFCCFCVRSSGFENKRKRGKVSGWTWRCPGKVGELKEKANKMLGRWRKKEREFRKVEL